MNQKKVVGIDFGGTKINFGVVTETGQILGEEILLPTNSDRSADKISKTIVEGVLSAIDSAGCAISDLQGIGIGSPGPLDLKNGVILKSPNLPTMKNYPLKKTVADHFKIPVAVNNDGNCFVLGEAFFGAGKDANIVCGVTLGTGFGFGIVFNHKIYTGSTGTAAEVWCSPYADSNFEEYGSARTVVRIYTQKTNKTLEAKDIYHLAEQNDPQAIETFAEFGKNLGKILAIMVNILDPDVFVIGGSVSNAWDFFHTTLKTNLIQNINDGPKNHLKVTRAALGDNAGVLGAAALVFSQL